MTPMKKFLSLAVAATLSTSLVPTYARADTTVNAQIETAINGVLGTDTGTISVSNARKGETYSVYRLFELASFADLNTATGEHGTNDQQEAYSYVIDDAYNPWYTFLTTYGPDGSEDVHKYAVLTTASADDKANAYFLIDANPITIKGVNNTDVSTYHVITPTSKFSNSWDLPNSGSNSSDADGNAADGDIMSDTAGQSEDLKYGVVQRFAQEALKYATTTANAVPKVGVDKQAVSDGEITLLENAPLGYYLVGTSMGVLASLDTTNKNVTIYEKNDEPEIEKTVLKKGGPAGDESVNHLVKNTDNNWVNNTDADFNDYIQFRTIVTTQQGAKNYVIHDVMESTLEYVKSNVTTVSGTSQNGYTGYNDEKYLTKVYLYDGEHLYEVPAMQDNKTNYELKEEEVGDGCTFEICFQDADGNTPDNLVQLYVRPVGDTAASYSFKDIRDGNKLIVTYWAKMKMNAQVYGSTENAGAESSVKDHLDALIDSKINVPNTDMRNTNSTILTYGNKSYSRWFDATVTTYQFDIVKTNDYTDNTKSLLDDAKFSLFKASVVNSDEDYELNNVKYKKTSSALVFDTADNNVYHFAGDSDTTANNGQVNQLTSKKDHEIHLDGLEAGTYLLVEDKSPTGYNKLSKPVVITINAGADNNKTSTAAEHENTITAVFTPNSGANATTVQYRAWDAKIATGNPATYTSDAQGQGGLQIVNQAGAELPSTGGAGTVAFYVVGGVLLVGSVVALVTKHRLKATA